MQSVIHSKNFDDLKNPTWPFILVLAKGEKLNKTIKEVSQKLQLPSATLSGLGAIKDPTLAYYDLENKKYHNKKFSGIFELLNLSGNIIQKEGTPFAHLHVTLSDEQFRVIGGHLMEAEVGVTAEISFTPMAAPITRRPNREVGLSTIEGV